jgi:1,4-alpha-glucan branching enzyme
MSAFDGPRVEPPEIENLFKVDPYLRDHKEAIVRRYSMYHNYRQKIEQAEGSLDKFSKGYEYMGFHQAPDGTITYREWAQSADRVWLVGDFSMYFCTSASAWHDTCDPFVQMACLLHLHGCN